MYVIYIGRIDDSGLSEELLETVRKDSVLVFRRRGWFYDFDRSIDSLFWEKGMKVENTGVDVRLVVWWWELGGVGCFFLTVFFFLKK